MFSYYYAFLTYLLQIIYTREMSIIITFHLGIQCNLNIESQQKVVDKKNQSMGGDPDKGSECEDSDSDSDNENEMTDRNYSLS